jgi:hypothetical protein
LNDKKRELKVLKKKYDTYLSKIDKNNDTITQFKHNIEILKLESEKKMIKKKKQVEKMKKASQNYQTEIYNNFK